MVGKVFLCFVFLQIFQSNTFGQDLEKCQITLKMIDASGKIPSGLAQGNLVDLGAYDECLAIESGNVTGKYCMVKISSPLLTQTMVDARTVLNILMENPAITARPSPRIILQDNPEEQGLLLGVCVPNTCPLSALQHSISETIFNQTINITVTPVYGTGFCQTKDDLQVHLNAGEWIVVSFLIFILVLMVLSTIYDIYIQWQNKEAAHEILLAFSVKTNGAKLLNTSTNSNQLLCLNGIRTLSMMWIVLGHRNIVSMTFPNTNLLDINEWIDETRNMYILNFPVAVDSFFVLSGLLVAYVFLLATNKGIKFNIFRYYLHRYLRLTPVFAVIILLQATILDYIGSGPSWPMMDLVFKPACTDNWWTNLLYIHNYYDSQKICVGQSWYLAADFQLYLLSPLVLLPLIKWPKITLGMSTILILLSMVSSFVVSWHYNLPGFTVDVVSSEDYMRYYYTVTHTRYGPWLMGIILGYYIYQLKKNRGPEQFTMNRTIVVLGWILSLSIMAACLFAPHHLIKNKDRLSIAFFNGFHRHGWALALSWVIFACLQGYGGFINSFLSWSVFQVLSRFTYTIYLVHLSALYMLATSARTNSYFTDFGMMYHFCSDFTLSLILAVCLTLAFETPVLTIEKVIFQTEKTKKPELPVHIKPDANIQPSTSEYDNKAFVKD